MQRLPIVNDLWPGVDGAPPAGWANGCATRHPAGPDAIQSALRALKTARLIARKLQHPAGGSSWMTLCMLPRSALRCARCARWMIATHG